MPSHGFVTITLRSRDADALRGALGLAPDERSTSNGGLTTLTYHAAPDALWTEREDAAARGLVFYGSLGAVGEDDPGVFVAVDGALVTAQTNEAGELTCRVDSDGDPVRADLESARRYLAAKRRADAQLAR